MVSVDSPASNMKESELKYESSSHLVQVAVDLSTCLVQCCNWCPRQLKLAPRLKGHTLAIQLHTCRAAGSSSSQSHGTNSCV
jgi:hypothetical protein